jgi:hypothetical protein
LVQGFHSNNEELRVKKQEVAIHIVGCSSETSPLNFSEPHVNTLTFSTFHVRLSPPPPPLLPSNSKPEKQIAASSISAARSDALVQGKMELKASTFLIAFKMGYDLFFFFFPDRFIEQMSQNKQIKIKLAECKKRPEWPQ